MEFRWPARAQHDGGAEQGGRTAQGDQQRVGTANEAMLRGLNLDGQSALNTGANQAIGAVNNGGMGAAGALTAGGSLAQQLLSAGGKAAVGSIQGSNAAYSPIRPTAALRRSSTATRSSMHQGSSGLYPAFQE